MAALAPIRVFLVDDHRVVRSGIRMLLESQRGIVVVGEAAGRADGLPLVISSQPDVILLDLDLGSERGSELIADLLDAAPQARILLLTGVNDFAQHRLAVHRGAMGLVLKEQAAEVLVKAIEKVFSGEVWLDRRMLAGIISELTRPSIAEDVDPYAETIATLTEREREVIGLICEGLPNKAIGQRLNISETTVRHHLTAIFSRLSLSSRLELVVYAYRHGLASVIGTQHKVQSV